MQQVTKVLAENTNKLNSIVANSERASHRFEPLLESSQEAVRTLQTQILPEARKVLASLEPLLDSSHDTVRALQTQILPEAHKVLTDLDDLSTGVATKINRDPSILIRGTTPPPPGPGEPK